MSPLTNCESQCGQINQTQSCGAANNASLHPFFLFISLSLRLLLFNVNVFPLQASLFFSRHDRAFTHAHLHPSPAYTRRRACVHAARPRGASSNLFLLSLGCFFFLFFPSLTLRGDQNERLRIEGILRTWIQNLQLSRNSGGGFECRRSRRNRWHQTLRLKTQ